MRVPLIAANWKMHKTVREAASFVAEFPPADAFRPVEAVLCPPFTALQAVGEALRAAADRTGTGAGLKLGAQNMYPAEKGAFTGEISPLMLKDMGCAYVILGHSERRHLFGETDDFIHKKIKLAFQYGLTPILCVGETLEERKQDATEAVCRRQLSGSLGDLDAARAAKLVIAYEPVWAIGTGVNAGKDDAEQVAALIRQHLAREYGPETADAVRILYGGSVKPENAGEYFAQKNIDGALVGGASLEAGTFHQIIRAAL